MDEQREAGRAATAASAAHQLDIASRVALAAAVAACAGAPPQLTAQLAQELNAHRRWVDVKKSQQQPDNGPEVHVWGRQPCLSICLANANASSIDIARINLPTCRV